MRWCNQVRDRARSIGEHDRVKPNYAQGYPQILFPHIYNEANDKLQPPYTDRAHHLPTLYSATGQ
jgi:hypothetical protein